MKIKRWLAWGFGFLAVCVIYLVFNRTSATKTFAQQAEEFEACYKNPTADCLLQYVHSAEYQRYGINQTQLRRLINELFLPNYNNPKIVSFERMTVTDKQGLWKVRRIGSDGEPIDHLPLINLTTEGAKLSDPINCFLCRYLLAKHGKVAGGQKVFWERFVQEQEFLASYGIRGHYDTFAEKMVGYSEMLAMATKHH